MGRIPLRKATSPPTSADVDPDLLDFALCDSDVGLYRATLDEEPRFTWLSPAAARVVGMEPAGLLEPGGWSERVHPDDREAWRERLTGLEGGEQACHEYRLCGPAGVRWMRDRRRAISPSGVRPVQLVGSLLDVSAERNGAVLEDALQGVPDAFCVVDADGDIVHCNPAYAGLLDLEVDNVRSLSSCERIERLAAQVRSIDGAPIKSSQALIARLEADARHEDRAQVEVELASGHWKLISLHGTRDGGRVLSSTDITRLKKAEQVRQDLVRLLHDAVESIPNDFAIIDRNGRLVLCNSAFADAYASDPDMLRGSTRPFRIPVFLRQVASIDGVPLGRGDLEAANWADRLENEHTSEVELANGEWKLVTGSRLSDGGIAVMRTGITHLKRAEQTLRASETRYRALIHHAPVAICEFDREGRLHSLNAKALELGGVEDEIELLGRPVTDFVHARDRIRTQSLFDTALAGEAVEFEHVRSGKLGDDIHLVSNFVPILDEDGEVAMVVSISNDVTASRRRELDLLRARETLEDAVESLSEGEALVRQVLEACPVPVRMSRIDDGEILYQNPAGIAIAGERAAAESRWVQSYFADPADRIPYVEALRRDRRVDDYQLRLTRGGGESFPGSVSARLIQYKGDDVIVSTFEDLTEKIAIEAQMARQRDALHQSEKLSALGELLASVSHELNNPLSVVVGQALLLEETAEDPRIASRAARIGNAADRCSRIVRTFLAMARQKPGEHRAVDLNEVVEVALEVTAYGLRTCDVTVRLELDAELPRVRGDRDQLTQVITNLLLNAQHALQSNPGPRLLRVVSAPRDNVVQVRVIDNGPGVSESIRSRIFEPLFTTKEVGAGTGIGLALCHRIIESHGGRFFLERHSRPGATFTIRLPVDASQPPDAPREDAERQSPGEALAVLVADDEPEVAGMLAEVLRESGHRVEVVHSGQAALRCIEARAFDVVLSDLRMPGLDGPALHAALERTSPELVARLAFITGDTMDGRMREFLERAGRPFLEKPIRPDEVRALVAAIGGRHSRGRE